MTTYSVKNNKWWLIVLSFIVCHLSSSPLSAQTTFTDRLQKSRSGEGRVTVTQDQAIEALVNEGSVTSNITVRKTATGEKTIVIPAVKPQPSTSKSSTQIPTHTPQQHAVDANQGHTETPVAAVDTVTMAKKSSHTYKTTGFRVQVFAGGNSRKDRQQAERVGNELRTLFPQESVYVHFYSPRWICRMGNYRTYEEAHQQLQEVKRLGYNAATIVKGKITLPY